MPFPQTIPAFLVSKKDILERAIANKREKEARYRQSWDNASKYFDHMQLKAVKHDTWTSDHMYNVSYETYKKLKKKELHGKQLEERKAKLMRLLREETVQNQMELKNITQRKRSGLPVISYLYNSIDNKYLEASKPVVDIIDSTSFEPAIIPVEESSDLKIKLQEEKSKFNMLEVMKDLQNKEQQASKLQNEQEQLQLQTWRLEQAELERRNKIEKLQSQHKYGRNLLHQYKLRLQRQAEEILEELAEDEKMLQFAAQNSLNGKEAGEEKIKNYQALQKILDDQKRIVQLRKIEAATLYNEEAAHIWQSQTHKAEEERNFRQRLLNEVLDGLKQQIRERTAENLRQQEMLIGMRQKMLTDLENARDENERQHVKDAATKEAWKDDFLNQIRDNEQRDHDELRQNLVSRDGHVSGGSGDAFAVSEMDKLSLKHSRPSSVRSCQSSQAGNRRFAWN